MRRLPALFLPFASWALFAACTTSVQVGSDMPSGGATTTSRSSTSTSTAGPGSTSSTGTSTTIGSSTSTSGGPIGHPCSLPGSLQFTSSGTVTVPGGDPSWPSLAFLHLPAGFCAHYFGTIGNARQLRFAPTGDLFVASPTALTTGGGQNGQASYVILPDDNSDGVADTTLTYISFEQSGAMNQGMLFANGSFYYQDGTPPGTKIMRVPYAPGDKKPSGPATMVANITYYTSSLHWPKTLDVADDGSIYVGNGGDQSEACQYPHPFHGGIRKIDPMGQMMDGIPIAQGLRNPIAVRCAQGHDRCFAIELALDYSAGGGGREKLIPIHQGDDWGFPCCATQSLAYPGVPFTDCSMVQPEQVSFLIGDTPFGLEFEPGNWPGKYNKAAFVVTHGAAGSWTGARMVSIQMDPSTGLPVPGTDKDGQGDKGSMSDFATGWDDGTLSHGRPAAVAFAPDGRLFVANDNNGVIFWIAPID